MNDNSFSKNMKAVGIGVLGLLGVLIFIVIPGGIVALFIDGGFQTGTTDTLAYQYTGLDLYPRANLYTFA